MMLRFIFSDFVKPVFMPVFNARFKLFMRPFLSIDSRTNRKYTMHIYPNIIISNNND